MSFLTVEDVNGILFSNQGFWWHEIDTSKISTEEDFTNVKYDFVKISRTTGVGYEYSLEIDNDYWTKGFLALDMEGDVFAADGGYTFRNGKLFITASRNTGKYIKIYLYMGASKYTSVKSFIGKLKYNSLELTLERLNDNPHTVDLINYISGLDDTASVNLSAGLNDISPPGTLHSYGFLLVNLIKSDFVFSCTQSLTVGKVNKVVLGTNSKYKPDGAMIGTYTPNITVEYNNQTIEVVWDSSTNDYVFNLDLSDKQNEGNIRFKVIVEDNQVLNASETIISLPCSYEAINNYSKLRTLFKNGGIGRITSNISLTSDLILSNDVYLISEDKTLTMNAHKIVVLSDKTFKANNVNFTGGTNTIQQNTHSKVELTNCTFTNCTGLGSVIDCQIDVASLDNTADFTTIITECTFTNNDLCILHGGDLTITGCTINGKISDKNYPYFLYQTDGTAIILQSQFDISSNSQITSDIEFNPCIFTCGETGLINGHSHTELQVNNLLDFFETQRNTSSIDLTYKYSLIDDYIRLKSDKGFCHSVSSVDYVFKTNVTPERI